MLSLSNMKIKRHNFDWKYCIDTYWKVREKDLENLIVEVFKQASKLKYGKDMKLWKRDVIDYAHKNFEYNHVFNTSYRIDKIKEEKLLKKDGIVNKLKEVIYDVEE